MRSRPLTSDSLEPRYTVVLAPVLVLLVAQLATTYWRALLLLLAGFAVSFVVVDRMNTYFRTTPAAYPTAPRNLAPLVATLDRLHLDRVYADYWLAYVLDFDTRERIVAAQSRFGAVRFRDGIAVVSPDPVTDWVRLRARGRRRAAERARLLPPAVPRTPIVRQIERTGTGERTSGPSSIFSPPG